MRIVLVEWHDANSIDGWKPAQQIDQMKPTTIQSVGWLHRRTKKETVLVSHISEDKDHGAIWTIPTGCIVRIVSLVEK